MGHPEKNGEKLGIVPDSLIFDMDGTLWDALDTYIRVWKAYLEKNDLDIAISHSEMKSWMGLEEGEFLERILPELPPAERKERYREVVRLGYDMVPVYGGRIYEGVPEGLRLLSTRYPLFIVSNCPKDLIKHFMQFAQISDLITDSLAHGQNYRPKHENIQTLINRHGLKQPVYIGDTQGDALQSELAGIPFVFMEYGFGNANAFEQKFSRFSDFTDYYMSL